MLWRHLFRKKGNHPASPVASVSEIPLGYALEARMLFDGAVAATVDQTAETQATTTQTASAETATQTDGSHADGTTDHTDSSSSGTSTQSTTSDSSEVVAVAGETTHKEVVFVDTSVADYQTLVNQVPVGTEVVLLDSSKDGLTQMAEWAQTHSGYDAIHIISHGAEGRIYLGGLTLDTATAAARQSDLSALGAALTETGDILLYGCSVASGDGVSFIEEIASATGADVAASSDLTGSAEKGGDWTLEKSVGTDAIQATALSFDNYHELLTIVSFDQNDFSSGSGLYSKTVGPASFTINGTEGSFEYSSGNSSYMVFADSMSGITATKVTIAVASGYTFDLTSFSYYTTNTDTITVTFTYADNSTITGTLTATANSDITLSDFSVFKDASNNALPISANDVVKVVIASSNTSDNYSFGTNNYDISDVKTITPKDTTSTLTAGAASEATTFSTTATSVASATSLLDFTITDTGASDGVATTVSALYANVSGTATSSELSKMTFLLSGPDATNVVGTYDSSTGRVTFSGLSLSIADGGNETYTIKAYYSDNTSSNDITDRHTVILSVNASSFTTGSGSSTFTSGQSSVTNGSGASIDVVATKLIYSQSPSTSVVSGINFTTQPTVIAIDDRGNIDTDFSGTVTLSENGSGSLTGTTSVTASNGTATFSGVRYTSASDADANFTLTAASGSLVSATSASINPDVVATTLVFSTQPVPVTIQDGQSTGFSTVPVVQAVDANGMVDQDYTTNIVLSVTDPNDGTVDGTVNSLTVTSGDQDPSSTTVTLTPSGGIATYTGLIIQYTNSGSTNTLALRATSGSLTAVNSSSLTSTSNTAPVFSNLNGGATYTENGSTVVIDSDVTVADTELDALNSGLGNYNGASITIARNGGASSNDVFGNSGLLGTLTQGQNFTYNGTTVGSVTTNSSGTLVLTFNSNATSAIVDTVLQSITYTNSSDSPPSSVTLSWTFNDGSLNSAGTNQAVLSITPINDAPTLSSGATVTLTSTTEDVTSSSTAVSSLLSSAGYADVDSGAVSGIALTALTGNGTWQYSTDSGTNWFSVGTVSSSSALLLSATTQIRYAPDRANGETATFSFRAWDQTSGMATSGATKVLADTSTTGGSSAFSANSAQASLMVTSVNDAPVVSGTLAPQSVAQGGSLNFTVPAGTFIDPDGDTLTLSATLADGSPLPSWLSFNAATGTFSGTPANGDVGNLSIKVTANDGDASVSTSFGLTVTNVNDAPVVSGTLTPQSVAQGGSLSFTLPSGLFTDPDGDTLTLSATLADGSPLPSWLSFNAATGTFSGTPANGDVGNLSIKVTANDGDASVSTSFSLTVTNVNDAPVVSGTLTPQSVAQGDSLNFTLPSGLFTDPDGDTLTLSATLADGSPLPSWLSFNAATGTFSGTPANGDVGNLSIKVTANDGDASVSTSFSLTVTNVNDAPVVSGTLTPQSVAQGGSLSFTLPSGLFTDPDGDTLTLSATLADGSPLPSWLSFNAATGTFSGTSANGDVGNLSIKVTANDGDASVSTSFSLTVTNVNDAPVVSGTLTAQSVAQGGSLSFTLPSGLFTDPDGDTLTLSATLADGSPLPSWLSFNAATGTFSGTPANGDVGNLSIKVTANDGDASVSTSFSLTVTNVNDAPVVSGTLTPQSVAQGGSLSFTLPSGLFTDPDGDTLTLSATLADGSPLPSWLSFNAATGTFSGTPANGDVGNLSIKVTANDGDASVSTSFSLTVTNVNDAPVVSGTLTPQSVAQGGSLSFTLPSGLFTDPDGDTLTLSATLADGSPLPSWLSFNAATGTFSGTPANGDVGNLSIKVTANDGDASVSTSFSLTVTNVNDAPVVSGTLAPQSVAQGGSLNFTVPAGTFIDPDGDTLTLSATLADGSPLPSWLSFNAATGTFSGTPANGDVGNLSIKVTANDGDASVSTSFGLTVTNVNDAPVVSGTLTPQSVAQGGSLSFTLPSGLFTDPDGDTLTLSATLADGSPLPSWLSFNAATGTFSGTPANGDVGNLSIKVTANDGDASVSTSFSLTVTNVNDAPVVSGTLTPQSVAQGDSLNFTLPSGLFTDPDGDTLTLSATLADGSPLPSWLSFNAATGTFSGTPANGDVGNLSIKVTANDGDASVSTSFSLTVTNVNDAPVVSGTLTPQSVAQGGSLSFTLPSGLFTDPDGDTLTLSATLADGSPLPSWLSFNAATGTFSGTSANGDVGNLSIKVTANDGDASVSTSFSLTVTNVNDAPVVSGTLTAQSVAQGGSLSFTLPSGLFTDPDGDTLTLSATLADGSPLPSWLSFNAATGTFSGTPANGDVGNLSIKVTANDGDASVSTSFSLTVTNVNDAPVVSGTLTPQSVAQGGSLNFTLPSGLFTDPDGDTLTLSATLADGSPLPSWLSFNAATGTFSGTPANGDVGNLTVRVIATDASNATVSTAFELTVANSNVNNGDPEFRTGSTGPTLSTSTQSPAMTVVPNAPVTLGALFAPTSLGSLNTGGTPDNTTLTSSIFQASQNIQQTSRVQVGQMAGAVGQSTALGGASRFESSLGSFPSFNNGGSLGGSSSLAGMFSGLNLPSLSPMEVFSGGSWRDISSSSTNTESVARPTAPSENVAMEFSPGLERQLQYIGDRELQRLDTIEQALVDLEVFDRMQAERDQINNDRLQG